MTTIEFANRELIEERAAQWIAAIDRGLTAAEEQEFYQWLSKSPVHGDVLLQLAGTWDLLDVLSPISKLLPYDQDRQQFGIEKTGDAFDADSAPSVGVLSTLTSGAGLAKTVAVAALVVLVVGSVVRHFATDSSPDNSVQMMADQQTQDGLATKLVATKRYTTDIGERMDVSLPDGSEVKLNTNSEINVHFQDTERRLELLRGEAYFVVKPTPDRPFVVLTKQTRVTAIGTAFSVNVSAVSDTEVLVSEGRVMVDRPEPPLASRRDSQQTEAGLIPAPLYLGEGQRALVNQSESTVSVEEDIDSALAWREGRIVFSGETLEQVVEEIGRYTPLEFSISDSSIATIRVGGFFKTGDLTQLLMVLEQNFGVKSERVDDQILLSKAR